MPTSMLTANSHKGAMLHNNSVFQRGQVQKKKKINASVITEVWAEEGP